MGNNDKMITSDEIEVFLSELTEILKYYYEDNPDYISFPNDICNLVREGIKMSLIQNSILDIDFSNFVINLITEQYFKYGLSEEQISSVKSIVESSELLSRVRKLATEKGSESVKDIFPSLSLNITRGGLSLRENNNDLNNSNKKM